MGTVTVYGAPRDMTLFQNGDQQLAYVCADSQVNIVDVTNPANHLLLPVLGTFANDILTTENGSPGNGLPVMSCTTYTSQNISYLLLS